MPVLSSFTQQNNNSNWNIVLRKWKQKNSNTIVNYKTITIKILAINFLKYKPKKNNSKNDTKIR